MVIPKLHPGNNVIPQLVNIIKNCKGLGCIQHLQVTQNQSYCDRKLSHSVGGAPSQKPYLKNGTVEIFLNSGDAVSMFKLPKISHLFDNNLSLGIGGAPSQKPYLKNSTVEKFLDGAVAFSTFKCSKISHLFDISSSPGVGGAPSQ